MTLLLVALGGALGAVLRFIVDGEIKTHLARQAREGLLSWWPVSTFLINVVGSATLGIVTGSTNTVDVMAFFGTGVCGGFTTFSTASVESLTVARAQSPTAACLYAATTLMCCYAAFALGGAL